MKIIPNAISDIDIQRIRSYVKNNADKTYVNWQSDSEIIDRRTTIEETSPEFSIIQEIVSKDFSSTVKIWSAHQIQTNPHNIHIDDYGNDSDAYRYTYVLAFDTIPEFKTMVWVDRCKDNNALHTFIQQWGDDVSKKRINDISLREDLEHTWDENQNDYIADYLKVDGIFEYQKGAACLFYADQLHCTNNWRKHDKFSQRELLQIHVLSHLDIFFNQ